MNRGKDWFAFTKDMVKHMTKPIPVKRKEPSSVKGIANDTRMAPHSPSKQMVVRRL